MTNFSFYFTSLIVLCAFSTLAQNNPNSQQAKHETGVFSTTKADYISQKGYLYPKSVNNFQTIYGDSLQGFNETQIKTDLLNKGLSGEEFLGHIKHLKRQFIISKYQHAKNNSLIPSTQSVTKQTGLGNTINVAPCVNEGFESTPAGAYSSANAITGWTLSSRNADGTCASAATSWTPGSSEFSIVATPIIALSTIGTIPNSPFGGSVVAMLNDLTASYKETKLSQTFPVTSANAIFNYAFAGLWQDGGSGHGCCSQSQLNILVKNCSGAIISCLTPSLYPANWLCPSGGTTYSYTSTSFWTNWQTRSLDLSGYIGSCITIEVISSDCAYGGHAGTVLFDAYCSNSAGCFNCTGSGVTSTNFCPGSSQASIQAPPGNASYSWLVPPSYTAQISAAQASLSAITVTNPVPGDIFTVTVSSSTGCSSVITYTLAYSQVSVGLISTAPACPLSSNGTATVYGSGSGTGYNYTWLSSTNSVVSTASVATNLSAGIYTIQLIGPAGCGSAAATASVGNVQPTINVISNSLICEGANTGVVQLSYDPGYVSTSLKTLSVTNNGMGAPPFNYTSALASSSFTVNNLYGPGTYNATFMDGNCSVSTVFTINTFMTSQLYSLSPQTSTVCHGQNLYAGVSITSSLASQFTYSWSPVTFLFNNNGTFQQTLITPTAAPGNINTVIYTVAVTSNSLNCTTSKTMAITVANPQPPSINPLPQLCTNSSPFQITSHPTGGIYNGNPAVSSSGLINPSLFSPGNTTFYYIYSLAGCTSTASGSFSLSPPLSVNISGNTSLCEGQSTTLLANGASLYTWFNSSTGPLLTVTPNTSTSYFVIGKNVSGTCSDTSSIFVDVFPLPVIHYSGDTILCLGESSVLSLSGADSYSWNTGSTNATLAIAPTINTTYTVQGTNSQGSCSSSKVIFVEVLDCTGISTQNPSEGTSVSIYPNPTKGILYIETEHEMTLSLHDGIGKSILDKKLLKGKEMLDMSSFAGGVYFLTFKSESNTQVVKVVKVD